MAGLLGFKNIPKHTFKICKKSKIPTAPGILPQVPPASSSSTPPPSPCGSPTATPWASRRAWASTRSGHGTSRSSCRAPSWRRATTSWTTLSAPWTPSPSRGPAGCSCRWRRCPWTWGTSRRRRTRYVSGGRLLFPKSSVIINSNKQTLRRIDPYRPFQCKNG